MTPRRLIARRIERIDWRRTDHALLTSAAVAAPLAVGLATGHAVAGSVATLGGYLWSISHLRSDRPLAPHIAVTTAALLGIAGGMGSACTGRLWLLVILVVFWAAIQAVADLAGGTLRMPTAMSALCLLLSAVSAGGAGGAGGGGAGGAPVRQSWLLFAGAIWVAVTDQLRHPGIGHHAGGTRELQLRQTWRAWSRARPYAVLLAVPTALAASVTGIFQISHGAWTAATVLRVLQHDEAATISRARNRVAGTAAGAALAAVLLAYAPAGVTAVAVVLIAVTAIQLARPTHYGEFSFFVTLIALELTTVSTPHDWDVAITRILLTLVGTTIAVLSGLIYNRWLSRGPTSAR